MCVQLQCNREIAFLTLFYSSTENGEKTEKAEPEPQVKEEEPEYKEEVPVKAKPKKEKKHAEEGFELWNELEVQRIKFMVSFRISYFSSSVNVMLKCFFVIS